MGEKKNNGDKKTDAVSAVFKIDMHCAGCVDKIVKCVKAINGVESVKPEIESNKLTVFGKMDPMSVKEKLEQKTKKKVDLASPQGSKKDKENKEEKNNKNVEKKDDKKKSDEKTDKKKSDEKTDSKKPKEPQVSTVTLKVELHCQGCVEKINKVLSKTKGVQEKAIDKKKDQVTVKGTMDVKVLVECLKDRLKRDVEVVQPKKEKEGGGGDKNESGGNGKKGNKKGDDGKMEESKIVFMSAPGYGVVPVPDNGFGYPPQQQPQAQYVYGYPGYNGNLHAPQMFSDENPNACSIM